MSILKIEPQIANSSANFSFGNVFASNFYYANGALFSGGGSGTVKYTAATTPPSSNNSPGDQWFNTTSQTLYEYINDGTGNYWVDILTPTFTSSFTANSVISGNSNVTVQSNGNITFSSAGTSNVVVISNTGATLTGNLSVSGNITSNINSSGYLIANNGMYTTNNYTGSYTSGIVVDYVAGTGRISVGTAAGVSFYKNGVGNTVIHSIDSNGNTVVSGTLSVAGTTVLTGATTIQLTSEIYNTKTGATGNVTHDLTTGGTFYHTNPAANFTANFTNVPTTDLRIVVASIMVSQGATGYLPNAVQIEGVPQTIKWLGGTAPTANNNKTDIFTFSLQRSGVNWLVYGQGVTYG